MGRLTLSTTMTVDGVVSVADWYVSEGGHDSAARDLFARSAGIVLGRKTYEGLAEYWTQEEGLWADVLDAMPKFVASSLELVGAESFDSGVVLLRYRP